VQQPLKGISGPTQALRAPCLILPMPFQADECMALGALARKIALDDADYTDVKKAAVEAQNFIAIAVTAERRRDLTAAREAALTAASILMGLAVTLDRRIGAIEAERFAQVGAGLERIAGTVALRAGAEAVR
jgi:hypothetical protein